jgi:hypothetical protein
MISENLGSNWKLTAGVSAVALASGAAFGLLASNLKSVKPQEPKKWVRVGVVSELCLFPVKSCQGIQVDEASTTMIGLQGSLIIQS